MNEGYLSVTWLDGSKALTQSFETDQILRMAAFIQEKDAKYNTYINLREKPMTSAT